MIYVAAARILKGAEYKAVPVVIIRIKAIFYFGVLHPVAYTLSRLLDEQSFPTTLQIFSFIFFFIFECCILLRLSMLILYGAVNHSCFLYIKLLILLTFLFHLCTHYMFRPPRATLK
jgi:hypothetical protein